MSAAGLILQAVAPGLIDNMYFKFVMPPSVSWQMILMVGVIARRFCGRAVMGDFKFRWLPGPDLQWRRCLVPTG